MTRAEFQSSKVRRDTMLKKIISGGQAGVELAALDAAIRLGFSYGGWAYNSKRTEDPDVTEQ